MANREVFEELFQALRIADSKHMDKSHCSAKNGSLEERPIENGQWSIPLKAVISRE